MTYQPKQRVLVCIPEDDVWHFIHKDFTGEDESPTEIPGIFIRYRTNEERDDWRKDDDCYVQLINDTPRVFPSKWLKNDNSTNN